MANQHNSVSIEKADLNLKYKNFNKQPL